MNEFIAQTDKAILAENGLDSFDALWTLQLENIDEPNNERGGWSTVSYLELGGKGYFLKRQVNHLTRSLKAPFGEPTFAREFRNIIDYQALGIPAVTVAYFATRKQGNEKQAIIMTHALEGWCDLESYLPTWKDLSTNQQQEIIKSSALLLKKVHDKNRLHGCFYPKHIFLKLMENVFESCLIDLEKTRSLHSKRDRLKDIDTLMRRTQKQWSEADCRFFLSTYLTEQEDAAIVNEWLNWIVKRSKVKEQRA